MPTFFPDNSKKKFIEWSCSFSETGLVGWLVVETYRDCILERKGVREPHSRKNVEIKDPLPVDEVSYFFLLVVVKGKVSVVSDVANRSTASVLRKTPPSSCRRIRRWISSSRQPSVRPYSHLVRYGKPDHTTAKYRAPSDSLQFIRKSAKYKMELRDPL